MKLSLGRVSTLALLLGSIAILATSACADSEVLGEVVPDDAGGPAVLPDAEDVDATQPPPPVKDAAVDAGPKVCSDHGFCPTPVPDGKSLISLWGDGSGIVWGASQEGDVFRWDGTGWRVHASDLGPLNVVWGSGPTDIWVGGEQGLQHGTGATSAEVTFAPVSLPGSTTRITSIWGLSAGDIWAVGGSPWDYFGSAYHFVGGADPASGHWEEALSSDEVRFTRVWGTAAGGVWIGGLRSVFDPYWGTWTGHGTVLHDSGDGDFVESMLPLDPDPDGVPWDKEPSIIGAFVASKTSLTVWGQPVSPFARASVWRGTSQDDGKTFTFTWAQDERPTSPAINSVFGTAANDIWAAGDYGRLIHWNGTKWSTTAISLTGYPVKDPFFSVWAAAPDVVWVGGKGTALRFDPTQEKNGGVE